MSSDKKEHIINTAIELFAIKGFEGTSIREIAAAANVNLAMINYYFGSKEKLFESIIEYKATHSRGAMEEITLDASLTTQMQKIERIIESYVERLFLNRHFHRVMYQEMVMNYRSALQEAIITKIIYPNSQIIKNVIQEGIDKGEFKEEVDAQLSTVTLVGSINQVLISKRFCNKMLNKEEEDYVPYEDEAFRTRVIKHLQSLMRNHLLKQA
jgi:AcrR family transcriptional regulator